MPKLNTNEIFLADIIELYPTIEQINRFNEFIYAYNYIYDICIDILDNHFFNFTVSDDYEEYKSGIMGIYTLQTRISEIRNNDPIMLNIPLHSCYGACARAHDAFKRYKKYNYINHPVKHLPNNMTLSFDVENTLHFIDDYVYCQGFNNSNPRKYRVGPIKCQHREYTLNDKLYNNTIYVDNLGKWYLYTTYITNIEPFDYPQTEVIGIDLGCRLDNSNTIVCSNGIRFNQPDTKHLDSRISFFQSLTGKDYENRLEQAKINNININIIQLSRREQENLQKFQLACKKKYNVLNTFYHQVSNEIIRWNPKAIVLESPFASIIKMNRPSYRKFADVSFYNITEKIKYKAVKHNIPIIIAPSNFKSSYICSNCGNIKTKDLKQSQIFKCEYCGTVIDRDDNAAINLANYYNFTINRTLN